MANGLFDLSAIFPQGPLPYQQPGGGDYVNQVSHRLGTLAGLFDPGAWRQALTSFPDPLSAEGREFGREMFGGPEGAQNLALDWGVNPIGLLGQIVYHGSPHKWTPEPGFPMGRPRLDKIGTGEGAQAYGHGMYFAESPGVARSYQPKDAPIVFAHYPVDGNPVFVDGVPDASALEAASRGKLDAYIAGMKSRGARKQEIDFAESLRGKTVGEYVPEHELSNLYSLDLPDERIPGLLDWDKPLSEQSEGVRKMLEPLREAYRENPAFDVPYIDVNTLGRDIYAELDRLRYADDAKVKIKGPTGANKMRELGIPGLRYLDAGSRGAGTGTANYVIWDQALLDEMARRMAKMQGLLPDIADELPAFAPEARKAQWRTARANAALPVDQGGLGLGPENMAAERAAAMEFEGPLFHGRSSDFAAFDPARWGSSTLAKDAEEGAFLASNPRFANEFASIPGGNVMPLMTRADNPTTAMMELTPTTTEKAGNALKLAKRYGYDQVTLPTDIPGFPEMSGNTQVVFNPANIRSRFAAFDPKRRNEADLLASWLLPAAGLTGILGYLGSGDGFQ